MMQDKKNAQISMEFLILVMLGFMIFIVFSIVAREQTIDVAGKKEYFLLKDVVYSVQTEINSAFSVDDGFERTFSIPEKINYDKDYDIQIIGNYLIANISSKEVMVRIQTVSGSIQKGNNTLRKQSGELILN